jgi:hypothetical protein
MKLKSLLLAPVLAVALLGSFTVYTSAHAQGIEQVTTKTVTSEVIGIDHKERFVTLRRTDGTIVEVQVGPEARNFDQIKVGDTVVAQYTLATAISLGTPGEKPETTQEKTFTRTPKGDMPGGVVTKTVDASATITNIDKKERTLTLEFAEGKKDTVKIDPAIKKFDSLKVGDVIHISYTKALAILVERP